MEQVFMQEDAEVWNDAVAMALEWGENFGKPVQERLMHKHKHLTRERADIFDHHAREAKYFGIGQFERVYVKELDSAQAYQNILQRYPLTNQDNLSHMATQGQYYGWHDNG